jgi:RND superfamily putative drug exporter
MRSEASLDTPYARLGAALARGRVVVVAAFATLLAAAAFYGASAADHLPAGGFEVPGSESDRAVKEAERRFGIGAPDVLVLYRDETSDVRDPLFGSLILDLLEVVFEDPGVVGATTYWDTSQESLVSHDRHETLVIVSLAGTNADKLATLKRVEPLLRAVDEPIEVAIGGHVAASILAQATAKVDLAKAEAVAIPIALVLTLLFFRSVVAALLPIVIGGFAMASCAALARVGSHFMDISIFALNVAAFLGLGLSIDYALLLVQRFREETGKGLSPADATATTLDTAGRAIFVSGLTVVVSLAVLIPVPVPILRSIAIGGSLAVLASLLGALLLLPALLSWLGPRIDAGAIGRAPEATEPSRMWRRIGGFSMRHPWLTMLGCLVVLAAFASPVLHMQSAVPDTRMFASDSEVRRVDKTLGDATRFDPGGASIMQVVATAPGDPLAPDQLALLRAYAARIAALPGVTEVRTPLNDLDPAALSEAEIRAEAAADPLATRVRRTIHEHTVLLVAGNEHPWRSLAAAGVLDAVRAVPHPGIGVKVGGATAQMNDLKAVMRTWGVNAAVLVLVWNFLVLLIAFRSVFVPLKATLMNILSLSASYGLLVIVFQDGWGAGVLGFEPLEGIDPTIPVILFAVVFGLSMDYEVFLLSRIQEEWRRTGDNRESVLHGIEYTGRIITSAALIMIVVIGAFAAGDLVYVKQVGVGIGAAVALDVTLVRALLVPATMQLMGEWNWWAPRWMRRRRATPAEV